MPELSRAYRIPSPSVVISYAPFGLISLVQRCQVLFWLLDLAFPQGNFTQMKGGKRK